MATVVDVDVQSIAQDVANCLNGVSDEDCNEFAFTCRSGLCVGDVPRYSEVVSIDIGVRMCFIQQRSPTKFQAVKVLRRTLVAVSY